MYPVISVLGSINLIDNRIMKVKVIYGMNNCLNLTFVNGKKFVHF